MPSCLHTMDTALAIDLRNLTKRFGALTAVDAVSLQVPQGSIFGFLGPNGAGKSTTVRLMAGLLQPSAGEALVLGHRAGPDAVALKRLLGVVPDQLALFEHLSIAEHLDLAGSLYELSAADRAERAPQLLRLFDLDPDKRLHQASYGMRKKTALAMALLPNPRLLLLDEPFEGLDPVMTAALRQALTSAAASGITVFITTHMLDAVDGWLTGYAFLQHGRLVAQGSLQQLAAQNITLQDAYLQQFGAPQDELTWLG